MLKKDIPCAQSPALENHLIYPNIPPIDLFANIPNRPATGYRVLHSADWHLGKPLGDLSREEEHTDFLAFLLKSIEEHQIDCLIVAGDIFDSAHPPQRAVRQYFDFISDLNRLGTTMVVIAGNHDSPSHLEAPREVLSALNVHVIGNLPDKISDTLIPLPNANKPELVIAAIPFLRDRDLRTGKSGESAAEIQKHLVTGIAKHYAAAAKLKTNGAALLATGHLTAGGCLTCPHSEREIHVGGLGKVDVNAFPDAIDYVALGHLHRPQAVADREHVRYSGSPLPLSFSEATDEKEVRILDFANGKLTGNHILRIPLSRRLVQWKLHRDELSLYLREKTPPKSKLTPWVEVIVEDALPGESLFEKVRELAAGRPYEVVRVLGKRPSEPSNFVLGEFNDETHATDLLNDPAKVFDYRVLEEENLTEAEADELKTAFAELLGLHAENSTSEVQPTKSNPTNFEVLPHENPPHRAQEPEFTPRRSRGRS